MLFALVAGVCLPLLRNDFINFDDPLFITANLHVRAGLTRESARWAFTSMEGGSWQPLTWLSHTLDCQLFGLYPSGHHLSSLLLHATSTVLLFLALHRMTGTLWRSVLVAVLFGVHPLHVEPVAWASARKDVLSGLFWMLALLAYAVYVGHSRVSSLKSKGWYALALLFFACGLMSKPTILTLPLILLLLDWWPLRRFQHSTFNSECRTLFWEKLPFLALGLVSATISLRGQVGLGAVSTITEVSLPHRLHNALLSCVCYVAQTFWPTNLACFYPYPRAFPIAPLLGASLLGMFATALALWGGRRRQWLAVGWLWFVITLLPQIGLIQVGSHSRADRYTYIPLIGLFIIISWGLATVHQRRPLLALTLAVLAPTCCALASVRQVLLWKNTETLFHHALQVTKENDIAYDQLGTYCAEHGRTAEAIENLQKCLAIRRRFEPLHNLALAFASQGNYAMAIPLYQEALQSRPNEAAARKNLAFGLVQTSQPEAAAAQYRTVLQTTPGDLEARNSLGIALTMLGKLDEAVSQFREVLRANPDQIEAHGNIAYALVAQKNFPEAIDHYRHVLRLAPNDPRARQGLGSALTETGKLEEAIQQFTEALRVNPNDAGLHYQLGLVLERQGQREQALAQYTEALRLKPDFAEAQHQRNRLSGAPEP
jgi:protein O-mannosyl-transferase